MKGKAMSKQLAHENDYPITPFKPHARGPTFEDLIKGSGHPYCFENYHPTSPTCQKACSWSTTCYPAMLQRNDFKPLVSDV